MINYLLGNTRYRGSPKYNKLDIFEDKTTQKDNTSQKSTQQPKPVNNLKDSQDLKVEKNWLSRPTKPELSSKQCNLIIKELFLVEMPKDFYDLWHFCKTLRREKPEGLPYIQFSSVLLIIPLFRRFGRNFRPKTCRSLRCTDGKTTKGFSQRQGPDSVPLEVFL